MKLLEQNASNNCIQPNQLRSDSAENDRFDEIGFLRRQIEKLERQLDEKGQMEDNENDSDYDDTEDTGDDYNLDDQIRLDFLETKIVKNAIKLVSPKTLR